MKHIVLGVVAHVDAGKTTLSENLLYRAGVIRRTGRVDHGDVFFDTDEAERAKGITIYSKAAELTLGDCEVTLIDTPGHVDFSGEMERSLSVLDGAILVISGTAGVQSHTRTLIGLLETYHIPTIVFVNKMDLATADKNKCLAQLKKDLPGAVEFVIDTTKCEGSSINTFSEACFTEDTYESIASLSENMMEEYFENGALADESIKEAIESGILHPVFFGSALTGDGVDELVSSVTRYFRQPEFSGDFAARVFKITHDQSGDRLTWVKLLGGSIAPKSVVETSEGSEKINQIRVYSNEKYTAVNAALPGRVYALTGLMGTAAGDGLGDLEPLKQTCLEPVMTYTVGLGMDIDAHVMYNRMKLLEEEDPLLRISWDERLKEIHVSLMGEVQTTILRDKIWKLYKTDVTFNKGHIVYKETIAAPVEGVGHYEPLRHYSEAHILIEPAERGSGVSVATDVSTDVLDLNWQRLIMTNIMEKEHLGVLTGSVLTDVKYTVVGGRAHDKHTEGGDFRQATYRAIRQGLMKAKSILLEPYYDFVIESPQDNIGTVMSDMTRMSISFEGPNMVSSDDNYMSIKGHGPVLSLGDYASRLNSITAGLGRISITPGGYYPVENPEEIIEEIGYDPEADLDNTPSSVFCSHGAGFVVPWMEVENYMHVPMCARSFDADYASIYRDYDEALLEAAATEARERAEKKEQARLEASQRDAYVMDKELEDIFKRTFGDTKKRTGALDSDLGYESSYKKEVDPADFEKTVSYANKVKRPDEEYLVKKEAALSNARREDYLIVDGYNMIFAWDELKKLADINIDSARDKLCDILDNYAGFSGIEVTVVFDAYRRKGATLNKGKYNLLNVVYTKEGQLADHYIEQAVREITKSKKKDNKYRVAVATNDRLEQLTASTGGALRMSADELKARINAAAISISQFTS